MSNLVVVAEAVGAGHQFAFGAYRGAAPFCFVFVVTDLVTYRANPTLHWSRHAAALGIPMRVVNFSTIATSVDFLWHVHALR